MTEGSKRLPSGHKSFTATVTEGGGVGEGAQNSLVLLVKRVHVDSLSNCELMIGKSRLFLQQQYVASALDKKKTTQISLLASTQADFMFSCCSSLGLPRRWARQVAQVASGSPGETSEPVGSEGPAAEGVCQGGRAGCSAPAPVDLLAGAPASS